MKITKKEFVAKMCSYSIVFLGTTRKLYLDSELECMLSNVLNQSDKDRELMEHRLYTAHSNYLVSNNDSRLYLDKCKFYLESVGMDEHILVCEHTEQDSYDGADWTICTYYLIDYANTTVKG